VTNKTKFDFSRGIFLASDDADCKGETQGLRPRERTQKPNFSLFKKIFGSGKNNFTEKTLYLKVSKTIFFVLTMWML